MDIRPALLLLALLPLACPFASTAPAQEAYVAWRREGWAIPEPLGGLKGDAERGRRLVVLLLLPAAVMA